jgi:hypothetical protein
MEYIPIFLAFASSIIAIRGDTWDKTQIGIRKLTGPGRNTLALVVCVLIYSIFSTYEQRDQKQAEELEKKNLGKIIAVEVDRSLKSLLSPFKLLYMENKGGDYIPEEKITFDMMLDDNMLKAAQSTCLQLPPKSFISYSEKGATWGYFFHKDITAGLARLDQLIDRYAIKMNADILDAIHDLQANGYFSSYAKSYVPWDPTKKKSTLNPCMFGQVIGSHKEYLTMLKRIESLNQPEKLIR